MFHLYIRGVVNLIAIFKSVVILGISTIQKIQLSNTMFSNEGSKDDKNE